MSSKTKQRRASIGTITAKVEDLNIQPHRRKVSDETQVKNGTKSAPESPRSTRSANPTSRRRHSLAGLEQQNGTRKMHTPLSLKNVKKTQVPTTESSAGSSVTRSKSMNSEKPKPKSVKAPRRNSVDASALSSVRVKENTQMNIPSPSKNAMFTRRGSIGDRPSVKFAMDVKEDNTSPRREPPRSAHKVSLEALGPMPLLREETLLPEGSSEFQTVLEGILDDEWNSKDSDSEADGSDIVHSFRSLDSTRLDKQEYAVKSPTRAAGWPSGLVC